MLWFQTAEMMNLWRWLCGKAHTTEVSECLRNAECATQRGSADSKRLRRFAMRCSFPLAPWLRTWKAHTSCMLGGSPAQLSLFLLLCKSRAPLSITPRHFCTAAVMFAAHTHQKHVDASIHGLPFLFPKQNLILFPYTVALWDNIVSLLLACFVFNIKYTMSQVWDCQVSELEMLTPKILLVRALNVKGWLLLPELRFEKDDNHEMTDLLFSSEFWLLVSFHFFKVSLKKRKEN